MTNIDNVNCIKKYKRKPRNSDHFCFLPPLDFLGFSPLGESGFFEAFFGAAFWADFGADFGFAAGFFSRVLHGVQDKACRFEALILPNYDVPFVAWYSCMSIFQKGYLHMICMEHQILWYYKYMYIYLQYVYIYMYETYWSYCTTVSIVHIFPPLPEPRMSQLS